jgi:hypothetical protein
MTAYKLTKILNAALAEAGVDQTVKPQMMYNYVKNGLIKTNEKGLIEDEIANAFVAKFVAKRVK